MGRDAAKCTVNPCGTVAGRTNLVAALDELHALHGRSLAQAGHQQLSLHLPELL